MARTTNNEPTRDSTQVVGLFRDQTDAERGIQRLKQLGFNESQIGVALRDHSQQKELAESTGTQVAEGAATGAISGGVLGGVIGLLAGVGALAIPGIGPIIAGGTLASTLAGAGIGAAAGGLLGALVGMGIPEEDAKHFDEGFRAGGTLVTVNAGNRADEARNCLSESGADLGPTRARMSTRSAPADRMVGELSGSERSYAETLEPWRGNERRYRHDSSYSGPERRVAQV